MDTASLSLDTTPHSFMSIFGTEFDIGEETIALSKIAIPPIQRDYAQGRSNPGASRVRNRFLDSLHSALTEKPIGLDFIYGDIDNEGVLTPLDGQQRLTTLFLLHWYAAKKERIPEEHYAFLKKFSYETRYSAKYFCMKLVDFTPSFTRTLSEEIANQPWFPLDWKKDPTVDAMLRMLDAIHERFKDVPDIWKRLEDGAIRFYFLPIKDLGLTDELYIKMNSRGKPLTPFEHFKAELEHKLTKVDKESAERIMRKIDGAWTDLLWPYRNGGSGNASDNVIDDEFLRYFLFICNILNQKSESPEWNQSTDELTLLKRWFSTESENVHENIAVLEEFFDCWCTIPGYESPAAFQKSFMGSHHEDGKIITDEIDIFRSCLRSYGSRFPLHRMILLYAFVIYLQHLDEINSKDFARRIRIINNLIQNSADEIAIRKGRNRIPAILQQTEAIILTGMIDESIKNSFNTNQLEEEKEKIAFLEEHPESDRRLFALEDHELLRGQIRIMGLENIDYSERFESLFKCDRDKIDCALMAIGDYSQQELSGGRLRQYASSRIQSAWYDLFHASTNLGFEDTKNVLVELLSRYEHFSDEILSEISDAYITECESRENFPWRYYYIKYPAFRPGRYGKYLRKYATNKPYLCCALYTSQRLSENSYIPYLKEADDQHLAREDYGRRLVFSESYLTCENSAYVLSSNETGRPFERIEIDQDENGIDTEDRIIKLKKYLNDHKDSLKIA